MIQNKAKEKARKVEAIVFPETEFDDLMDRIIRESTSIHYGTAPFNDCESYAEIKALKPERKINFIFAMLGRIIVLGDNLEQNSYGDPLARKMHAFEELLSAIMRMKISFKDQQLINLVKFFKNNCNLLNQMTRVSWSCIC